jgi:HlyD family secretion protein
VKNLIYLLAAVFLFSCGKDTPHTKPSVSKLNEAVYASGVVKAIDQYSVYSAVNGLVRRVVAQPGDMVEVGDTILILDNLTSMLNTDNARLVMELSKDNSQSGSDRLREMSAAVDQAKEKYELDSSLFVRQQRLWDQSIGSKVDMEQKELAFQTSKLNYQAAQSRFSQVKKQLQNEWQRAQNTYAISQKMQGDYVVRADVRGRVFDVLKEKGELVTSQTPLAIMGSDQSYKIEMEVDEYDIVKVTIGQAIELTMDSYKGQTFSATVTKVHPIMNERTRTFTIEATFVQAPPSLYPNLTVEANIIIRTKENAMTIPRKYVVDGNYVYISKKEKRQIELGLRDFDKVEVLSGLDSSTVIFEPPTK